MHLPGATLETLVESGISEPNFSEIYESRLVPSIFRPWATDLLKRVRLAQADCVLDLACGTGIVARLAREELGVSSRITGVDANPEMIAVARSLEPEITWYQANAVELPFDKESFDVILCQQALQFFPDRAGAVREMRRILVDGGRLAISTWRRLEENPLFCGLDEAAARQFGSRVDRRFSLGDEQALCALFVEHGFKDINCQIVEKTHVFPDAESFLTLNLWTVVSEFYEIDPEERATILARLRSDAAKTLKQFATGAGLRHPMRANVVTAIAV